METIPSLLDIYRKLLQEYGPQRWWPADSAFEVMIGAVLTQNTAWSNVERTITELKKNCDMTPDCLLSIPEERLGELIRPSGYFRQKSNRVRGLCRFLVDGGRGGFSRLGEIPTRDLRQQLLSLKGIGPETADSILLYALGRPVFVVDAYTSRILERLGILPGKGTYGEIQDLFMGSLEADAALFNEYHALFVAHGKNRCRKTAPACGGCPFESECREGPESKRPSSNK